MKYTPHERRAVIEINQWLANGRNNKTALARMAGTSASTLSQVLDMKYPSPPGELLSAMLAAIRRDDERDDAIIPFTKTSISTAIHKVLRRTHLDRDFGIYAGRVGIGKTMALRAYAEDNPRSVIMLEAFPGATAPTVLRLLSREIGAVASNSTVATLHAAIVATLKNTDKMIVVDEAETLTDHALLHLRRISDVAGVGVALIGTPSLLGLVQDPDGRFGQITSRIGYWPGIAQSITEADARLLSRSLLGDELTAEAQRALWQACQGSARTLPQFAPKRQALLR